MADLDSILILDGMSEVGYIFNYGLGPMEIALLVLELVLVARR